jgi:hypothetical protein
LQSLRPVRRVAELGSLADKFAMRGPRVILVTGLLIVGLLGWLIYFGPVGQASRYRRFLGKDAAYYAQVARACDAVLQKHPIGSSGLQPYAGLPGSFSLSAQAASLPAAIRALHPDTIILSTNRVYVGFGVGRLAWGIIWKQDEDRTNSWTLDTNADGLQKRVYAESRP